MEPEFTPGYESSVRKCLEKRSTEGYFWEHLQILLSEYLRLKKENEILNNKTGTCMCCGKSCYPEDCFCSEKYKNEVLSALSKMWIV